MPRGGPHKRGPRVLAFGQYVRGLTDLEIAAFFNAINHPQGRARIYERPPSAT